MSDLFNLLENVGEVKASNKFNVYSKVIVNVDENTSYVEGTDTGRFLEMTNPLFGAQVPGKLLARLQKNGFQFQPHETSGALLDPRAEIGDAISAGGVYGGIYNRDRSFGRLMRADVAAPHDEEVNHEYKYESKQNREINRKFGEVRASILTIGDRITLVSERIDSDVFDSTNPSSIVSKLNVQAGEISAKVSANYNMPGGVPAVNSFAWSLTSNGHYWYAGNSTDPVMKIEKAGLAVKGRITATEGYIGSESSGFTIKSTYIFNGMTSRDDTTHNGVYIGTNGIALGKGAFKVDSSGNLTAKSISLYGSLKMYNNDGTSFTTVTAKTLADRANSAYTSTSKGGYCYSGATAGNSANTKWNNALNANVGIGTIYASVTGSISARSLSIASGATGNFYSVGLVSKTIHDGDQINYLSW